MVVNSRLDINPGGYFIKKKHTTFSRVTLLHPPAPLCVRAPLKVGSRSNFLAVPLRILPGNRVHCRVGLVQVSSCGIDLRKIPEGGMNAEKVGSSKVIEAILSETRSVGIRFRRYEETPSISR
jgi:hypothetical protein